MLINIGPLMGDLGSLHDAQTAAALDNKQNMEQREQYYATVRKPLRSPIHEIGTLERIPGNSSFHFISLLSFIPSATGAFTFSFRTQAFSQSPHHSHDPKAAGKS
jgi:hypothetical protein